MYLWNLFKKFSQNFVRQHRQKQVAFFFAGLCIFALAAPQLAPVSAQATQATVQEILDGNQVFIENRQASLNDVASQQQQVRTGNSRTALLFNTGAVARLSANSVLSIGQCARLQQGTILINGAVNACSSSITTGVRGTTYLLEVDESGNQQVKVLEGEVIVKRNATPIKVKQLSVPPTRINIPPTSTVKPANEPLTGQSANDKPILKIEQPATPAKQPDEVVLKAGEKVEVAQGGGLGLIQQLTENEFVSLLKGNLFEGFTNQIPGIDKVRAVFNGLFPGVNFPISIPGIPIPNIPSIPSFPF